MTIPVLPDPQKVQKTVVELQEVCRQFDELNFTLDELIAHVDAEIQNSPLTTINLLRKSQEAQNAWNLHAPEQSFRWQDLLGATRDGVVVDRQTALDFFGRHYPLRN